MAFPLPAKIWQLLEPRGVTPPARTAQDLSLSPRLGNPSMRYLPSSQPLSSMAFCRRRTTSLLAEATETICGWQHLRKDPKKVNSFCEKWPKARDTPSEQVDSPFLLKSKAQVEVQVDPPFLWQNRRFVVLRSRHMLWKTYIPNLTFAPFQSKTSTPKEASLRTNDSNRCTLPS